MSVGRHKILYLFMPKLIDLLRVYDMDSHFHRVLLFVSLQATSLSP
jgi:TRAP-type mannitol/chloroaromatic compound transport system permease large subunit